MVLNISRFKLFGGASPNRLEEKFGGRGDRLGASPPGHPGGPSLISVYFHIDWTEMSAGQADTSTGEAGPIQWEVSAKFLNVSWLFSYHSLGSYLLRSAILFQGIN